jgi:hypothetical protein
VSGSDKSGTTTIGAAGWTSGSTVAIGFNTNQEGQTGITLDLLTVSIWNSTGTSLIHSFSTAGPINFSASDLALQQGNGAAVFEFVLDSGQQATFNSLNLASNDIISLSATLGCATASATCFPSNDGADSFTVVRSVAAVPEASTWAMMLIGFFGIGFFAYRKRSSEHLRLA